MGFSWMIQIVQYMEHHQYKNFDYPLMEFARIESVTLGNEIPRWFNNQHVGSLISIDASLVMDDNNWIGIACCVIFVVRHETVLAMGPSKTKERHPFIIDMPVDFYGDLELVSDESDHMWLFFLSRRLFIEECHLQGKSNLGSMKREFKIISYRPGFHVEVKKYGYHWVYKQDLELSNLNMMHSGNLSAQKHKFLAIEQNEGRNQGKRSKGRISAKRRNDAAKPSLENTIKLLQNQFANLDL